MHTPSTDHADAVHGLPPELKSFCKAVTWLTLVSVVFCLLMRFVFHKPYPYDWPFFSPEARFSDFTIYQQKFALFHQQAFFSTGFPFTYPAPMAMVYEAFFHTFTHPLRWFLVLMVLAYVVPAVLFAKALVRRGLAAGYAWSLAGFLVCTSWPALLVLDRANVELTVWIAVALGGWAFARGKDWLAASLFGIAASLKLFPFVLLALFFTRRDFAKLLFGVATFAVVTWLSLYALGPTVHAANQGIADGMRFFHDQYMSQYLPNESALDHSPLAFAKTAVAVVHHSALKQVCAVFLRVYLPLTALLGVGLYFLKIRLLPWLNQLLILTIIAIYFTPFSGDGTLLHLYVSFALCCLLAIDAWKRRVRVPGLRIMMLCFAYLFSIESFFVAARHRFEGQGKCIVMLVLLISAFRYPLHARRTKEADETGELAFSDAGGMETASV